MFRDSPSCAATPKAIAIFIVYSRYGTPTVKAAEDKIAALEGAEAAVITSSGMSAILVAALATCQAGDEIVSMLDIYGGTVKLFEDVSGAMRHQDALHSLPRPQATPRATSPARRACCSWKRRRIRLCVAPTSLSSRRIAHRHKACVVVDNTFATPILQKPLELGADIVMHSATKYLGGHSDLTAGVLAGSKKWMVRARELMILTGGCLDPGCAYLLLRGLKTLQLRVERACRNAAAMAAALEKHPRVSHVYFPGLAGHQDHELASRQMKDYGMMVSFELRGGEPAVDRFIRNLKLWYLATSLGGVESILSYPLLSSHIGLSAKRLKQLGVTPSTVRLSVGIEDAGDLIADLEAALARA